MSREQDLQARGDARANGFTLIEVAIVISTMAMIAVALVATVSVVLRTNPAAKTRTDDARSLQGLVTWIPQDVDAAPPGGFDTDATAWPCGGPAPTNSYNVLAIRWSERTDTVTNFAATYRYEFDGDSWHIARYACDDESTASMGNGARINLTSELPPWDNLAPPAQVTMCDTAVDTAGDCPPGHEVLSNTSPNVESLKLRITRLSGEVSTIDAAPKNPEQDLADDPHASTNHSPTVSQTNYTLDMYADDIAVVDLNTTHNPTDADGDTLSVAIDSSEPMPPGVAASTADPLELTVTTDPALASGTLSPPITMVVSDPFAGWVSVTVTVNIIPEPNFPPTVAPPTYHLQISPGETVELPIDVTHGTSDPNGDPLAVTAVSWPPTVHNPSPNHPGPMDLEIRAKTGASLGPTATPIELLIEDGRGGSVSAWITVDIVPLSVNVPPAAATLNVNVDMYAGDTVAFSLDSSHGVYDLDLDPLTTFYDGGPAGITVDLLGGLDVELIADPSLPSGPLSPAVTLDVEDPSGAEVEVTFTVDIIPTPPPPSDCVLGSLNASPSSVSRQGGGSSPRLLRDDVTVTLTYGGSCDGLVLKYDTGDTSGLGVGTGRVFPPGSPTSIVVFSKGNGGTEKWLTGTYTLTAETTSMVTPNQVTTTLVVS